MGKAGGNVVFCWKHVDLLNCFSPFWAINGNYPHMADCFLLRGGSYIKIFDDKEVYNLCVSFSMEVERKPWHPIHSAERVLPLRGG